MPYLQPTFGPNYRPIALKDALCIGRESAELKDYPAELAGQLEPEQVRFEQAGSRWFLAAIGSGATTRVNGRPLEGSRIELSPGDSIELIDGMRFEVRQVADNPDATQLRLAPPVLRLTLRPKHGEGPRSPLLVTQFPLLISKSQGPFGSYVSTCPALASFVSRQHAQFFQMGAQIYLEDLGSTNGSSLNGKPVDGNAVPISSGDVVAFGHDALTFEIDVAVPDAVSQGSQKVPEGTVMISSARSFLNMYADAARQPAEATSSDADADIAAADGASTRPWQAPEVLLREPRRKLTHWWRELPVGPEVRMLLIYGGPALLLLLVVLLLVQDNRPAQIRRLVESEQPYRALVLASEYLSEYPEHAPTLLAAEQAMDQYLLGAWTMHMRQSEFAAATSLLADTLRLVPQHTQGPVPSLMAWMTDLALYREQRPNDRAVSLIKNNHELRDLLGQWATQSDQFTTLLIELSEENAEFGVLHAQAMSTLRVLKEDSRVLLQAIDRLQARLNTYFDGEQHRQILVELEDFREEYPRIADVDVVIQDVESYTCLYDYHRQAELAGFIDAAASVKFTSPLVRKRAEPILAEARALQPLLERLNRAVRDWKRGRWAAAIDLLDERPEGPWAAALTEKQDRYNRLIDQFQELLGLVQSPGYPDALIAFYTHLDPVEDQFLYGVLEDDFANHKHHAIAQAQMLADESGALWSDYGTRYEGISGGLRLESQISQAYREQADLLRQLIYTSGQALHINELLETEPPDSLTQLRLKIVAEVRRQRLAFESLRPIIGDELVDAKLNLLPELGINRDA